jgi:hypothetical protein
MHLFMNSLDGDQEIETCLSGRNNEVNIVLLLLSTLYPITDCIGRVPYPNEDSCKVAYVRTNTTA